jgi:hypothetical protein
MGMIERIGLGISNAAGNAADRFIDDDAKQQAFNRQVNFEQIRDQLQQARDARLSQLRVGEHKQNAAINTDEAVRSQSALLPGRVAEAEQVGKAKNALEAASPMTYQGRRLDPTTGGMIDVRDPADVALDRDKARAGIGLTTASTDNVRDQGRRTDESNRAHLAQEAIKREQILAKDALEARKELSRWMSENPRPDPKKSDYEAKFREWAKRKDEAGGARVKEIEGEIKQHRSGRKPQETASNASDQRFKDGDMLQKDGKQYVVRDGKPVLLDEKTMPAKVGPEPKAVKEGEDSVSRKGFLANVTSNSAPVKSAGQMESAARSKAQAEVMDGYRGPMTPAIVAKIDARTKELLAENGDYEAARKQSVQSRNDILQSAYDKRR